MNVLKFFNGTFLNQLNKKLREFKAKDDWKSVRNILVHRTSFEQMDRLSPGRNSVSDVVQLITKTTDAESIYFDKNHSGFTSLYIQSNTRPAHTFGSQDQAMLVVYRDTKGRRNSLELARAWDSEDVKVDQIASLLERAHITKLKPCSPGWYASRARFKTRLQTEIQHNSRIGRNGELSPILLKMFERAGLKVVECVPFTEKIWAYNNVKYVKMSAKRIELGFLDITTYNTLPSTIVIELRSSETKLISLSDLGVEKPGYYSHSDKMKIKPEHVAQISAFQNRFKRMLKGG